METRPRRRKRASEKARVSGRVVLKRHGPLALATWRAKPWAPRDERVRPPAAAAFSTEPQTTQRSRRRIAAVKPAQFQQLAETDVSGQPPSRVRPE